MTFFGTNVPPPIDFELIRERALKKPGDSQDRDDVIRCLIEIERLKGKVDRGKSLLSEYRNSVER